ncbi:hypothetical protein PENFLA_c015G02326 [Penicillium flavigenum]|uniref:Uncharacterized protein n=1 Tax=Penicillium flavigenum TaxID=254877 RepID=A0A1V6T4P3_9EURO|nr:hypothetical protein PENFLA_c015G02326 [Penicillium flavigenum]
MAPRKNDRLPDAFEAIGSSANPNRTSSEGQELPIDVVKYLRFTNVPPAIAERTFRAGISRTGKTKTSGRGIGLQNEHSYLLLHREWEEGPQFLGHSYDKQHHEGRETNHCGLHIIGVRAYPCGKGYGGGTRLREVIEKMPATFQREITGA